LKKENEKKLKLINLEHKAKEIKLIKYAKKEMRNLKIREVKDSKRHFKHLILYNKLQAKQQAQAVLKNYPKAK